MDHTKLKQIKEALRQSEAPLERTHLKIIRVVIFPANFTREPLKERRKQNFEPKRFCSSVKNGFGADPA
jgi:hypothetical protein